MMLALNVHYEPLNRSVLVFLNCSHFSPDLTQTWSFPIQTSLSVAPKLQAQTPQNLAITKILQNFRKTSTPQKTGISL